jgi:hypothetical protein
MFALVGVEHFKQYEQVHNRLTGIAVMPAMLTEAACAALFLFRDPTTLHIAGFLLLLVIWLSTFLLQVPCHTKLMNGFDKSVHRRLVRTNWIRTAGWTARAIIFSLG